MSRKYIAREVLKRLRLGEPLGEELIRKFIRFLPELYENSNGYDDFAKLRHDVFSAFRYDHADRLIGFDLGACWGAISEEESVSLDYAQEITSLRVDNSKLRELVRQMHTCLTRPKVYAGASRPYLIATECPYFTQGVCDYNSCGFEQRMRELRIEVGQ